MKAVPTTALYATALLILLLAFAPPAHGDETEQRRLCETWSAAYSYPSGIEQERCRSAFPELAMDYGAYCSRLKAEGEGDALSLAACLSYRDAHRPG
jgi:hypothetical protein